MTEEGKGKTHVGDGNGFAGVAEILEHVLDQDGALSYLAFCRCC